MKQLEYKPDSPRSVDPAVTSAELFKGRRMLTIEHNGERYTLRVTASGKLILTK